MKIELVFNIQEAVGNAPSEECEVLFIILLLINMGATLLNCVTCIDNYLSIDKYILLKYTVFYNLYKRCRMSNINKIGSLIIVIPIGIITIPASIFSICFYLLLMLIYIAYSSFKEFFKNKKED